ncbi:hypothetical protein J416_12272 [Gracilibacillus halophilus YIM-C55.5]|uniref:Uncharacterized protein n=1 Tax=Gracilibacillus halophilus YIM-C55.5 TaxID=1308866 RepID=N4WA88_9BACI|nr:hypothetical protein [Gracilibacillus halophilus]ENH96184.1 hypothetical protein J416_12272 [Gracilibacillus halophilus YIM-C55.5]
MNIFYISLIVVAFVLNLLGLMRFIPMVLTIPMLFVTIYLYIFHVYHRKQFKGFQRIVND